MSRLLQDYISQQAAKFGDKTAIVMKNKSISYAELERRSNQLARLLQQYGVSRGDRVCLFMSKSPLAVVAMAGVLKTDAMYVPIDTSSPASRVAKIAQASEPKVFLTEKAALGLVNDLFAEGLLAKNVTMGTLEDEALESDAFKTQFTWADLGTFSDNPLSYQNDASDPAHLLFTSGSTGTPKGVVIKHENVMHFVDWSRNYFGIAPHDKTSGHPPLHFDLSTFDIYATLSAGAELHMVSPELNLLPNKLANFIRKAELTQWFSVPSTLTQMAKFNVIADQDFPQMTRLLWCGEPMPTPTLMHFMDRLPHVTFTNLYGPTEATIASSYYTVTKRPESETEAISIGVACEGEELLVLDDKLEPVEPETIGELYISGEGLSPGYWRDKEKTDAAFLADPRPGKAGNRIYRTGDLGKVDQQGLFYCLGRVDSQIKSRGYRIELGEIEAALNTLEYMKESAVVGIHVGGFEGTAICCAYALKEGQNQDKNEIQRDLVKLVPKYMIPSQWMSYSVLPKNANGKIDRKELRDRFEEANKQTA
ncbi:MAG: amino acid adenylation domain-containing protein [Trueperaceae bacterium]|nr:amino acid adenylation domain-containing protein [Trueperaceae bacterium]